MPVKHGDEAVAVLATGSPIEDRDVMLHRIEAMQPLLDQVAIALEHARLYEESRDRVAEIERVNQQLEEEVETRTLAQERSRFQAELLENVRESVIATDLEGQITYWGSGAETLYGYAADEVLGRAFRAVTGSELEERERDWLVLAAGPWWGECRRRRQDGTEFWAESMASLVSDQHGKAQGYIYTDRDISQRKQAEEALRESEERNRRLAEAAFEGIAVTNYGTTSSEHPPRIVAPSGPRWMHQLKVFQSAWAQDTTQYIGA